MATWTTPRTWNIGELVTKAMMDTHIRDNFTALWVGMAPGDMEYYINSIQKNRLARPTVDSVLKNTSAGTPTWLAMNAIPGTLHQKAFVDFDAFSQSIPGTAWVDVTNATVNIVTTKTCTIFVHCSGAFAASSNVAAVRASIGGVVQSGGYSRTYGPTYVPYGFTHYRTGVPAGTITCKLQGQAPVSGSDNALFGIGKIVVEAIVE
jgi:hypothetical protein